MEAGTKQVAAAGSNGGTFACPDCEQTFTTQHALGGHLTKHARERREAEAEHPAKAAVEAALRDIVGPLQEQLADINKQIVTAERELRYLREARTQLDGVIRKIVPQPAKDKLDGKSGGARAVAERAMGKKITTLRQLIEDRPELFEEGVTANAIADWWKEHNLQPAASQASVRKMFEQLRDEGVLRADRITKGGGMAWMIVGPGGES